MIVLVSNNYFNMTFFIQEKIAYANITYLWNLCLWLHCRLYIVVVWNAVVLSSLSPSIYYMELIEKLNC